MKAILFDLDGTLLPMDNDHFTEVYFRYLAKTAYGWGLTDSEKLIRAVWKGVGAMVQNDGSQTNDKAFWQVFQDTMQCDLTGILDKFTVFYDTEFHNAKAATGEAPLAKEVVRAAREKADLVLLATNPLFPMNADEARLSWIGLTAADFDDVTDYETCSFCKPNPLYYRELLDKWHLSPEECIMIGNDMDEDILAAEKAGIRSWLLNDNVINRRSVPVTCEQGSYQELLDYIRAME